MSVKERDVQSLVEMGASRSQARAALSINSDVMEAAQQIFDGKFDRVTEDDDVIQKRDPKRPARLETPPSGPDNSIDGNEEELFDDGEAEDFAEYESDNDYQVDPKPVDGANGSDPYAGIFFSKDRREEVIEVEETPEFVSLDGDIRVPLMTQGEWMKGCPEGGEQGLLFQLYTKLSDEVCLCPSGCGGKVPRDKSMFFAIWPQFSSYIQNLRTSVEYVCHQCQTKFCLACGDRVDSQKASKPSYDCLLHCPDLQGVLLGVGLSMLEHTYNDDSLSPNDDEKPAPKKKRKVTPLGTDDEDEMYHSNSRQGKKAKGGTGYAGNKVEDTSGEAEAMRMQQSRDAQIGEILSQVRQFLPSLRRSGGPQTSDYLVHPTALVHLRRRFNIIGSSLLRNDSLADMSDRHVLYFELFEWFETISNHEALSSMMGMPIMVVASVSARKPQVSVATKKSTRTKSIPSPRERMIVYEGSSGPRELMESIVIQAQAAIKGLGPSPEELKKEKGPTEEDKRKLTSQKGEPASDDKGKGRLVIPLEDNVKLRKFCQRIITTAQAVDRSLQSTKGQAFVRRLHATLPKVSTSSTALKHDSANPGEMLTAYDHLPTGTTDKETQNTYVQWAQSIRFEYCDLTIPSPVPNDAPKPNGEGPPHYRHAYNNDIRMIANSEFPKRSLAIAKELATLTTNLPVTFDSSVFLRVDEARVDVLKALIVGPADTPYQNGCYLFDIFLGPNYNIGPPTVKYMTTKGGAQRFNPNLYADGKVCLSLLGTWQGPGWIAGKSTLLQVLISIQSMILNGEPYLNEPGWASSGGTPASKAYSANVRRMNVETAMLDNLVNPPEPFADIIRTHFRLKADSLAKQLDTWLAEDDGVNIDRSNPGGHVGSAHVPTARVAGGTQNGMKANVDAIKAVLGKLADNSSAAANAGTSMTETDWYLVG